MFLPQCETVLTLIRKSRVATGFGGSVTYPWKKNIFYSYRRLEIAG